MSFDLKTLEFFVRVAEAGAIGKAGQALGLSPAAATQRIQALETDVGTQLFNRTTRAVSLTSDGEVFLAHARRIIGDFEEALSELQHTPDAIKGDIRVTCPASFGRKQIAPFMAEFLALYPNLSVQVFMSDEVVDIVAGGFDLAIRLGGLQGSSLQARKLADSPRVMVATPDYLKTFGTPRTTDDLAAHNCLMRGDIKSWDLETPDGVHQKVKVSGNFSCNYAEGVTEAALSGLGITRKCRWEIAEYLESGELVTVLDDHKVVPEWGVYAVRSPSRLPAARLRLFIDFLQAKLKPMAEA